MHRRGPGPSQLNARQIPTWVLALAMGATFGCSEPTAPADNRSTEPSSQPDEQPPDEHPPDELPPEAPQSDALQPDAPQPACRLDDVPFELRMSNPSSTLALWLDDEGGALALADSLSVRVLRLDRDGRARGEPTDVPLAGSLLALMPVGRARDPYVVLTRHSCPESAHCILARRVADRAAEATVTAPLPGRLITSRRAAAGSRLHLAWSAEGGERGLESFEVGPSLGRVRRALGPDPADAELPVEILGLAAYEDRFAVLSRRGAGEDQRSRVTLTSNDHHVELEALEEALVVEAMALEDDRVSMVAGFEMSRPHYVELTPGRDTPDHAHALAPGEVPDRFRDRVHGALLQDQNGLHLRRRNAAGDPLGPPVTVVDHPVRVAAIARRRAAFLVAWLASDGQLGARWVRCASETLSAR